MTAQIEARVAAIIAETGGIEAALLTPETELAGLGLDSIVMVEAIFAIEEAFDIALPFDLGPEKLTFGHLCNHVAALVRLRR